MTVGQLIEMLQQFPSDKRVFIVGNAGKLGDPVGEVDYQNNALTISAGKEYRHSRVINQDQKDRELHDRVNKAVEEGKA